MKTNEMPGYQYVAGEDSELSKVTLKDSKHFFKVDKYCLINKVESNLPINNDTLTNLQEKIWFVVRPNPVNNNNAANATNIQFQSNFEYFLKKNDIIKLGRIKFVIRDINIIDKTVETTTEIFKNYIESV